jgi:hypothetical protein
MHMEQDLGTTVHRLVQAVLVRTMDHLGKTTMHVEVVGHIAASCGNNFAGAIRDFSPLQ